MVNSIPVFDHYGFSPVVKPSRDFTPVIFLVFTVMIGVALYCLFFSFKEKKTAIESEADKKEFS